MLTSIKTLLIRTKSRANLIHEAAARMSKLASETSERRTLSSAEGSLNVGANGGAVSAGVPALQGDGPLAEADLGIGIRPERRTKAAAEAQPRIKKQRRKPRVQRAKVGLSAKALEINQSLGPQSGAVGPRLSSAAKTRMSKMPKRNVTAAEVEVGIGVEADHDPSHETRSLEGASCHLLQLGNGVVFWIILSRVCQVARGG